VNRSLAALMLGSALVTLDGTAVTLALPSIARTLSLPAASLHWVSDAPLLVLALLLLPAGGLADRYGHCRAMRVGLVVFAVAAAISGWSATSAMLITGRAMQGLGAAFILPSAYAVIRAAIDNPERQARKFGLLAAWTGAAAVAGPLLGGALADNVSWRAVFAVSAALALLACAALWRAEEETTPSSQALLPAELVRARNCVAANVATFGLYFGVFGLPFVIVIYLQESLGYSALSASLLILPLSLMMFFAARFARLGARWGSRRLVVLGSVTASGGAALMAIPFAGLPLWAAIVSGTAVFGLGVSMAVSPVTQAAVAAVGESCAGAASALNHAVVRAAGLAGIAALGYIMGGQAAEPSLETFRIAMSACGLVGASCGISGALLLRDEEAGVL
jgi:DHA2 family methylenomycin A resistance protein-like MFS transporter